MEMNDDSLENIFEISKISNWIQKNNFKRVCLQFPEYLLKYSVQICFKLQEILQMPVYLLGDSNYESCCLDFLGAEHINADSIVHFGPVCFSLQEAKIPNLNIYEKSEISIENLWKELENCGYFSRNIENIDENEGDFKTQDCACEIENGQEIFLLIDTPYLHKYNELSAKFQGKNKLQVLNMAEKIEFDKNGIYVYIGTNFRKLENIYFSIEDFFPLYHYDPDEMTLTPFAANQRLIKRRHFLAEKIRDGSVFGLLMATVAVENYLKILGKLRRILKNRGKKCYVISVGKLSPEKLANFPEINVFVLIGCSMNGIFENEREFYAPLVTPSDVVLAFSKSSQSISQKNNFSYDFNYILRKNHEDFDENEDDTPDISLISGNIRPKLNLREEGELPTQEDKRDSQVSLKASQEIMEGRHGAGFLASKSWRGLEENPEKSIPEMASQGRSGIAAKYYNEPANS